MRGVSERVGRAGWAAERRAGDAVPRTPWHRPSPGPAARRGGSWGRPAPPPQQLATGWGLLEEGRGRREGPAGSRAEARALSPGAGRGGRPRKGGAPGRAAGGP